MLVKTLGVLMLVFGVLLFSGSHWLSFVERIRIGWSARTVAGFWWHRIYWLSVDIRRRDRFILNAVLQANPNPSTRQIAEGFVFAK